MVAADLLAVSPPAGSCVSDNGHRQDTPLTYVELGAGTPQCILLSVYNNHI